MMKMNDPRLRARALPRVAAASACAVLICGSVAWGQATLPLPAPGATPPAAPAPGTPGGDTAARARAQALAAKANVDVTEAWTRATTNQTSAPIYFHIVSAKDPDRLLSVEASMAKSVELRDDSPQATAKVIPNPIIDIPGGATINLSPGGRYMNLVGLKAPLKEGDSFFIVMKFDKAGTATTAVKILGSAAASMPATAAARRGDTTSGVTQR